MLDDDVVLVTHEFRREFPALYAALHELVSLHGPERVFQLLAGIQFGLCEVNGWCFACLARQLVEQYALVEEVCDGPVGHA